MTRSSGTSSISDASSDSICSDKATLIQKKLDELALFSFNAILEISKSRMEDGEKESLKHENGPKITKCLQDLEDAIEELPVFPGPDGPSASLRLIQQKMRDLQTEYEQLSHDLTDVIAEAEALSSVLRQPLSSIRK